MVTLNIGLSITIEHVMTLQGLLAISQIAMFCVVAGIVYNLT